MIYHRAILQYDGSDRAGFMHQAGMRTIQGELNQALATILQGDFTTRAASRTDKGVHALAQVIKISAEDPRALTSADVNRVLPPHMRCLELTPCPGEFIPSMDQHSKEYRYLFTTAPNADERHVARAPASLDLVAIQTCVQRLTGTHDFKNFWSIGGTANTTLREIFRCELSEVDPRDLFHNTLFSPGALERCWEFRIEGRGFLKHMVRHLVGALWAVGTGALSPTQFQALLEGPQREQRPWKKADPRGLFLVRVTYAPEVLA